MYLMYSKNGISRICNRSVSMGWSDVRISGVSTSLRFCVFDPFSVGFFFFFFFWLFFVSFFLRFFHLENVLMSGFMIITIARAFVTPNLFLNKEKVQGYTFWPKILIHRERFLFLSLIFHTKIPEAEFTVTVSFGGRVIKDNTHHSFLFSSGILVNTFPMAEDNFVFTSYEILQNEEYILDF